MRIFFWGVCCLCMVYPFRNSVAQTIPVSGKDWMLDGSSYTTTIYQNDDRDLILSNGLIERVFREGITIGLNNLVTGERLLRSVHPEAELTIDRIHIPVGGMTGQPVHNYFLPEWLGEMQTDPLAFHYAGYEVSPIKKRFDWKKRTEWMSSDPDWPPKGKMLTLKYKADNVLLDHLVMRYSSIESRNEFFTDNFGKLSGRWKIHVSQANTANSFTNEGKSGEILVPANTASYAECELDPATEILIARIHPGTDQSSGWGPGVAWVFDKKTIRFYLRTAEGKFGVTGMGLEYEASFPGLKNDQAVELMMQRDGDRLFCSYSYHPGQWEPLAEVRLPPDAVSQHLRIGKMDGNAQTGEFSDKGQPGRCRIEMVKGLGGLPESSPARNRFDYLKNLEVRVNYEIYDGIPLLCKWVTVTNRSSQPVVINTFKSEILAVAEPENAAIYDRLSATPNITVETDFAHAMKHNYEDPYMNKAVQRHAGWKQDKDYKTQIDWLLKTPCLLESSPEYGPEYRLVSGENFETHRTWELIHDSWDRERKTLQVRKMFRTVAPWIAENPVFMHVRKADNESVKKAIDQCAEVGFEMVIMTFWSGVNLEDPSTENLERMKMLAEYAHGKGVALGGYSLLASRSIDKDNDVIAPEGTQPIFGASPCLGSSWGQQYMQNLRTYFTTTGQDILEHDGSYPGDECASVTHPGHDGLNDSQWKQYQSIKEFYHWCKSVGIFLNIPDWYYMNGQNKTGMGYRETNWSLPREQQEVIERQNIYDGTWYKAPSMGWMMVPLVEYHGGGKAATIEPLNEHLEHYETRLANNFGAGVIACYRGPQLYDTPETKAIVKKWVDFYKRHRPILDSDLIHLRRPNGQDWDGFIHVNPTLREKGLLMVYNPLPVAIKRIIEVPVYYTGLTDQAKVTTPDGKTNIYPVSRDYKISMEINIPAKGRAWYIFE